jgi:hypothetical protein
VKGLPHEQKLTTKHTNDTKKRCRCKLVVASSLRLEIGAQRRHYTNQIGYHKNRIVPAFLPLAPGFSPVLKRRIETAVSTASHVILKAAEAA